jgi:hypothetical protein
MSKFSNGGPFETLRKEIGPMLKARGGRGGSVGGAGFLRSVSNGPPFAGLRKIF